MNSQVLLENEAYKSVYKDKNNNSTFKEFLHNCFYCLTNALNYTKLRG